MTDTKHQDDNRVVNSGSSGMWSPLKSRLFTIIFLTNLFATLAVFMNALGGAWVLTDITDSPAAVAALQIAVTIPGFLLALVAGALADVVNRKRLIQIVLAGSALVAGAFAFLSATSSHTQASILGLTALLGVLTALAAPAWMAVIPGLVTRTQLADAMTLSSAGMSGAMALGPAIGGLVIAAAGPTWVFSINVAVFAAGIGALTLWRPTQQSGLPAEHLGSAMRLGLQYLRYDRPLQVVIAKIIPFALTGTALISLLPAVARFRLDAGPAMFGLLSGAGGVGAVLALFAMPTIRQRLNPDLIVSAAMLIEAGALMLLATTTSIGGALVALVIAGGATLAAVSTVMTVLQIVLPAWIRGRGVAVYLLALQGSFALGAFIWGAVAEQTGLRTTLIAACISMAIGAIAVTPLRLRRYAETDTTPAQLIENPPAVTSIHTDDGPIAVVARWDIAADQRDQFLTAMEPVRRALKRQGALSFHLVEDVQHPGHMIETFTVATWAEYQRLPQRSTTDDQTLHEALIEAVGPDLPTVTAHRLIDLSGHTKKEAEHDPQ
jgi:MFS family permease